MVGSWRKSLAMGQVSKQLDFPHPHQNLEKVPTFSKPISSDKRKIEVFIYPIDKNKGDNANILEQKDAVISAKHSLAMGECLKN